MRVHHLHIEHTFTKPVERIFAHLSEHEHLRSLFRAPVHRVRSGGTERNGVGSCRRIGPPWPLGFEETVVEFIPNELIVYRITKGSLLRGHRGVMRFTLLPDGRSHLEYTIRLASPIPGLATLLRRLLTRNIAAGLVVVDARA
jgi:uncharacterized protein YndB with AHSA1/START domain